MPHPLPDDKQPNRLRELRKAKGEKVYDLVPVAGKDPSTITRYETGSVAMDIDIALAFARHFGVSMEYLLRQETAEVAA